MFSSIINEAAQEFQGDNKQIRVVGKGNRLGTWRAAYRNQGNSTWSKLEKSVVK